jgi:hypothetical protein
MVAARRAEGVARLRGLKTLVLAAVIVAVSAAGADAKKKKKEEASPPPVQTQAPKPAVLTADARARELMDLDADAVRARYGEPRLLRKEAPAQVWQYADDACVLVLVLYDPKEGRGPPKVKYAQGRMLPGHESEAANCMTGPRSTTPPNASAVGLPPASPVVIPGRALSGTPVYSPGDPVPPGAPK